MNIARKTYNLLCSPRLLHYVLPIVIAFLIVGTVAQKYIGLYQATQIFFAAPIIWIGGVFPILGMPVFMGLIFLNIIFKLAFKSPWKWRNCGVIITHIGVLLLLLGGIFTALFSSEGYIALGQGDVKNIISDYHAREFVVMDESGKALVKFDHLDIKAGQTLELKGLPFSLKIIEACQNCKINKRIDKKDNHKGMAQFMHLTPDPLKKNNEENMSGLTYQISHSGISDIFVSIEDVPRYPEISIDGKTYSFALRREHRELPFSIELLEFKKELYPSSNMAKSYQSTVMIKDGDMQWQSVISMNAPLRYKGYTFFQSSFVSTEQGDVSVLAAVWNVGRSFPYIAGIVMCIGLILHLFIRKPKAIAAVLLLLTIAPNTYAGELATKDFAQIPILHDGRVKPIDSFARAQLKSLSGRESGATEWLMEVIFNPATAESRPTIKLTNPEILRLLEITPRKSRLYSYGEISTALRPKQELILSIANADEKNWSAQQRELINLQEKLVTLRGLMGSLTAFLPLSITLPESINDELKPYAGKILSYKDVLEFRGDMQNALKGVIKNKGEDIESYTLAEQSLAQLSYSIALLQEASRSSTNFKVIPIGDDKWLSPWEALSGSNLASIDIWESLVFAYHSEDANAWDSAINTQMSIAPAHRANALKAEYYYNIYNPFYIGFGFCLLALITLIISGFWREAAFIKISFYLLICALLPQAIGIALRIYILDRPPVSTLYETILFVSLITTLYAVIAAYKDKGALWLWLGAALGVILAILGFSHSADGDSFVMLPAVLNTNFWLTTHVLCITAAYGFCALTSMLAHYALIHMIWRRERKPDAKLIKNIYSAAILALFFAAIGTVLGGIWADQSWGRFWGWDPKENGAMLIVLWLIWVVHGRVSGQMRSLGILCGLAYLSVILGLSWFGVNLLNVGLHAYGFTDSAAYLLGAFIIVESLFIICAALIIKKRKRNA